MYDIRLIPKSDIKSIIPILMVLNDKIPEEMLDARLDAMMQHNYECVGVYDDDKLIGISGLWTLHKYYVGKHIEPDNVIILPEYRNQGLGEKMMEWIFDYARKNGCEASELNCYVNNSAGIKFWLNQGYKILGFHLQKVL